jgi:DNA-binding protein HU-beta
MARHTKSSLIDSIAKDVDLSKAQVEKVYNSLVGNITKAISGGDTVALSDFGVFGSRTRKARSGRNPKTGSVLQIAAKKIGTFRFGKKIRDVVSGITKGKK